MRKIILILAVIGFAGLYSCKTDKTKIGESKKERRIAKKSDAQVKAEMDNLLAELDKNWNEMMASDDQKMDNLQTLHARIGRDKNYDKKALTEVISQRDNLKIKRYNREEVGNVAQVDAYDSAQIKVMDATTALLEANNLTSRDSIAGQLSSQIQEDDSRVPIYRGRYDKAAKNYNQFLNDYAPQLQKLGPPYSNLKPVPLFTAPEVQ